ncbi:MAG: aminotransferase class I/II-fold pyridoxal phosphate-dependent enzyme [Dehalococcoidia bacterium]|nr:aminotransferase class I/II-fold pyridoxal phosphate-dependent enzyme [Dehalococcoidia bacterium]
MPAPEEPSFDTRCVHESAAPDVRTPPLAPPLYLSSVYETPSPDLVERAMDHERGYYLYARTASPNVVALEDALAALEHGEAAVATASGMAAISSLVLALLAQGDHVVAASDLYGTTTTLLSGPLAAHGITTSLADVSDPASFRDAMRPPTKLVLVETVSNPLMRVADIAALAEVAHAGGAVLAVDASFTSPALSQALAQGADVVLHSATKYLGGHSDVTAGVVVGPAPLLETVRSARNVFGAVCSPLDAWLTLRGMKTLALRMERHTANALHVAGHLAGHPKVRRVYYAGLPSDPDHGCARRLLPRGAGGMLSFELADRPAVGRFVAALSMVRFAASLADVATTVSHPATTSHRGLSADERAHRGIGDGLVRLSVGIEAPDDIVRDLDQGLAAV